MSLEGLGVGCDGAAVETGGVVEAVLGVGDVTQVEEGAGVGWMGGEPGVEFGFSGGPVGFGHGGFGGGDFLRTHRRGFVDGCSGLSGRGGDQFFRVLRRGLCWELGWDGDSGCSGEQDGDGETKHGLPQLPV